MKRTIILLLFAAAMIVGCTKKTRVTASGLSPEMFVDEVEGKQTALFTLTNANGMEVCISNYGGRIVSIMVPDRDGVMRDVVLGFDNIKDYENIPSDFGACIGRYANRLNHGHISIDGKDYQLDTNNFGHTLHGGPTGWQYQVYNAEQKGSQVLSLSIISPDGDNGFPGEVTANCIYTLTDDNVIRMEYFATTTAPTVINMTNHSYFNLHGNAECSVCDLELWINSRKMTPVDSTFMTTGEVYDIPTGDPFDFYTCAKSIGQDIEADNEQLRFGKGYDHNWILNAAESDGLNKAATLCCPNNGICLEVATNEPGIQVYVGNFLDGTVAGKNSQVYGHRYACCLETQKYPDSPNKPQWPSALLRPGEKYESTTEFRFSVK